MTQDVYYNSLGKLPYIKDVLDKAIFKPLAKGYRMFPQPVRSGTSNFLSNLSLVVTIPNNVLQGDLKRFVYAGSGCAIYGAQAPLPLKEDFVSMHLSTPYQISKMAGELYCNFYWCWRFNNDFYKFKYNRLLEIGS